jgi:hypothetical protein
MAAQPKSDSYFANTNSVFRIVYTGDTSNPRSRHIIVREDVAAEALENVKKFLRRYNAERRNLK